MSQISFSDVEYGAKRKRTRREIFLAEMNSVILWARLMALIEPVYPKAGNGRRPYALETMLRIHFMQQWFALSDPTMEESLYDVAWPVAQGSGRTFYDSLYLALAMSAGCLLVTADLRFFNALRDTPWGRYCLWVENL